jgi:hypothetical protein
MINELLVVKIFLRFVIELPHRVGIENETLFSHVHNII